MLAVSDGATEAVFAREWADTLVRSNWKQLFDARTLGDVEPPETVQIDDWLTEVREAFCFTIGDRQLPWYTKAKLSRQGAFATFLGVRMTYGRGKKWAAVACGDSCVFHVVDGRVMTSFPLDSPIGFGNRPSLVPSNETQQTPALQVSRNLSWNVGDTFVLATDALACWLLDGEAANGRLNDLLGCESQESFRCLVERERAAHRLKNDDTTALIYVT